MIICKKCKKAVSYNSYFQKYICSCGWECTENNAKTNIEEENKEAYWKRIHTKTK